MNTQNTPTTSLADILRDSRNRPPLIPFTKEELAHLATIKDLEERDEAALVLHRQKQVAAKAAA